MDTIENIRGVPSDIDIGDVIEIIETDPDYTQRQQHQQQRQQQPSPASTMYNGAPPPARRCVIVEEPAQKQLRFRYECEGRSAGSIPGANSTQDSKTYPTIKVEGWIGRGAVVVVSCVTKDEPYRPHPHKLVGREGCKKGVCTVNIPEDTMTVSFPNLGIQCVKKKDIEDALRTREEIRVDPFRTGFAHRASPTSIDLNAVRLCFQVFIPSKGKNKFEDLQPVVSQPIFDKKAMSDLIIVRLSDSVCPVDGGSKDIILLCEKVTREDIQIRFYEEQQGRVVWEANGEFQPTQVHKQTAIWFRPPSYRTLDVTEPVKMFIQLRRPSDGATSVALPFQMVPLDFTGGGKRRAENTENIQNKRKFAELLAANNPVPNMDYLPNMDLAAMNIPNTIKDEPNDNSRSPYHVIDHAIDHHQVYRSPQHTVLPGFNQLTPSAHNYQSYNSPANMNMPSTSGMNNQSNINFNIPATTHQAANFQTLLNMDIQQIYQVESGTEIFDLAANLSSNLSLDLDQPMTNSLDRITNMEAERHLSPSHQSQF